VYHGADPFIAVFKETVAMIQRTVILIFVSLVFFFSGCTSSQRPGGLIIERSGPLVGLEVEIETPESPARGKIPLAFYIKRKNPIEVKTWLLYSVDGGRNFYKAATEPASEELPGISVDAYKRRHEIIWDSAANRVGLYAPYTNVVLRLLVLFSMGEQLFYSHSNPAGPYAETLRFTADNSGPPAGRYETGFEESGLTRWLRPTGWTRPLQWNGALPSLPNAILIGNGSLTVSCSEQPGFGFIECLAPLKWEKPFSVRLRTKLDRPPESGRMCLLSMSQSGGWKEPLLEAAPYETDRMRFEWENGSVRFHYRNDAGNWVAGKIGLGGERQPAYKGSMAAALSGIVTGSGFDVELRSDGKAWQLNILDIAGKILISTRPVKWSDTYNNSTLYRCWWGMDGGAVSNFSISYDSFRYVVGDEKKSREKGK
jgi:hypothetical protein